MIIRKIIPESVSEVIHLKNLKNGLTSLVLPFFFFFDILQTASKCSDNGLWLALYEK